MKYLVVPNINAEKVNIYQAPWLISPCNVFAAVMLGHAVGIDLMKKPQRVGLIHHSYSFNADRHSFRTLNFYQYQSSTFIDKDDYVSGSVSVSDQPVATANIEVTLVLEFSREPCDIKTINKALKGKRFAGGTITHYDQPFFVDELSEEEGKKGVIEKVKGGFWVTDVSQEILGNSNNKIEDFLNNVYPLDSSDQKSKDSGETKKRWIVPSTLGYANLTEFTSERGGIRQASSNLTDKETQHAFCEPMVGLCEFIGTRQVKAVDALLWRMEYLSEDIIRVKSETE